MTNRTDGPAQHLLDTWADFFIPILQNEGLSFDDAITAMRGIILGLIYGINVGAYDPELARAINALAVRDMRDVMRPDAPLEVMERYQDGARRQLAGISRLALGMPVQ